MIENKWINCFFFKKKYALRKFRSIDLIGAKFCCFFFLVKQKKKDFRVSPVAAVELWPAKKPVSGFIFHVDFFEVFFSFFFFFVNFILLFSVKEGAARAELWGRRRGSRILSLFFVVVTFCFVKRGFFFNSFFFLRNRSVRRRRSPPYVLVVTRAEGPSKKESKKQS